MPVQFQIPVAVLALGKKINKFIRQRVLEFYEK